MEAQAALGHDAAAFFAELRETWDLAAAGARRTRDQAATRSPGTRSSSGSPGSALVAPLTRALAHLETGERAADPLVDHALGQRDDRGADAARAVGMRRLPRVREDPRLLRRAVPEPLPVGIPLVRDARPRARRGGVLGAVGRRRSPLTRRRRRSGRCSTAGFARAASSSSTPRPSAPATAASCSRASPARASRRPPWPPPTAGLRGARRRLLPGRARDAHARSRASTARRRRVGPTSRDCRSWAAAGQRIRPARDDDKAVYFLHEHRARAATRSRPRCAAIVIPRLGRRPAAGARAPHRRPPRSRRSRRTRSSSFRPRARRRCSGSPRSPGRYRATISTSEPTSTAIGPTIEPLLW